MQNTFHIIREEFTSANERESRAACVASKNTHGAAAAHACGIGIIDFSRTIEDTPNGAKTVATWAVAEGTAEFRPDFQAERITTGELLRRMRDEDWQQANPNHPISFMAQAMRANHSLGRAIAEKKPLVSFKRGKFQALLTIGGDKEKQRRLLTRAGFTPTEITEILSAL